MFLKRELSSSLVLPFEDSLGAAACSAGAAGGGGW